MKPGDINDRFRYIYGFITLVCVLIILRILYLGIVEKENYKSVAEESIYKYEIKTVYYLQETNLYLP